jgi:hypothetical protein
LNVTNKTTDKPKRRIVVSDFETSHDGLLTGEAPTRTWVWCWATTNLEGGVETGRTIDEWFTNIEKQNTLCYFHNLGFDGEFVVAELFKRGHRWVPGEYNKPLKRGQFTSLVSSMKKVYSITWRARNGKIVELNDSIKKLPSSVKALAKSFGMDLQKGDCDHTIYRPEGEYQPTEAEWDYVKRDVLIVAKAIKTVRDKGDVKLTAGADAFHNYKVITFGGKKELFEGTFPPLTLEQDQQIRAAYKGGFTYCDPRYRGRLLTDGEVYDVNSMYPWAMRYCPMPYGVPRPVRGRISEGVYVQNITFTAQIKPDHIPCIQIKNNGRFNEVEYQTLIDEPVTLTLTNVDIDLMFEQYDVEVLSYDGGLVFNSKLGWFDDYIDYWIEVKQQAKRDGDKPMETLAKLKLNGLYGKFATNPDVTGRYPIYTGEKTVKWKLNPTRELRDPVYTAVGALVTANARAKTVRTAQSIYPQFCYADTDSVHLLGTPKPGLIDVDEYRLGAWKRESVFSRAVFNGSKRYAELTNKGMSVHVAGLPKYCQQHVTFEHLLNGFVYSKESVGVSKLRPVVVQGGVVLVDTPFTLDKWRNQP